MFWFIKMRLCKLKLCLYLSVCIICMFFLLALLSFYQSASATLYPDVNNAGNVKKRKEDTLGSGLDGLFWFVQVTDLHLSIFRDHERVSEFEKFCSWIQTVVRTPVVVASGDLTDAKTSDHLGSTQWEQEWRFYQVWHDLW